MPSSTTLFRTKYEHQTLNVTCLDVALSNLSLQNKKFVSVSCFHLLSCMSGRTRDLLPLPGQHGRRQRSHQDLSSLSAVSMGCRMV